MPNLSQLPAVPERLTTPRLLLRVTGPGDGISINAAVLASFAELGQWMPWAKTRMSLAESETFARESAARFRAREELNYSIFLREHDDDTEGAYVGQVGLHHLDWAVPCFEFGYWLRTDMTGSGYMTEAVMTLRDLCFAHMGAARLEIRCDERNRASAAVAERAGFTLNARMERKARANDGTLATILLYARLSAN